MSDEKKKISVIVPVSLLDRLRQQSDCNITEATIKGLELLVNNATNNIESDSNIIQEYLKEIEALKIENTGFKARSEELQAHNETLKHELEKGERDKADLKELLKSNDESQLLRITDLKEEITVLRKQLDTKDDTIRNLTTITESQLKGYKLIEAPGTKKSWWRFW